MKNPTKAKGLRSKTPRNNECEFYGDCLGYAGKQNWQHFTCTECLHRDNRKGRVNILELQNYEEDIVWDDDILELRHARAHCR